MRVTHEVVEGETVATILQAAQNYDVDLVCMTTQRWSDVDRWLNGSVMDAVLRQTNLPLLVVPPTCDAVWSQPTGRCSSRSTDRPPPNRCSGGGRPGSAARRTDV